jgi:hypothetical protein
MKKLAFLAYCVFSFLLSLTLATNLFAYLLHYAHILGRPHIGRWYEPFHLLYWPTRAASHGYKIRYQ